MTKIWILLTCLMVSSAWGASQRSKETTVQLLNEGTSSLAKRIELIRSAKKTIEIEYYIFARDRVGKMIFNELIKKAREKVKVRILLDGHKLLAEIDDYEAEAIAKYGIELKFFNRTHTLQVVKGQFRNHRKSLTVDDERTIIGGRNLSESYYNLNKNYNFIDRDVLITGPLVKKIRRSFDRFWRSKLSVKWESKEAKEKRLRLRYDRFRHDSELENRIRLIKRKRMSAYDFVRPSEESEILARKVLEAAKSYPLPSPKVCHDPELISDRANARMGNRRSSSTVGKYMRDMFSDAEQYILIDNPYFLNFKPLKSIFERKLNVENVRMRLYTNGLKSNENMAIYSTFYPQSEDWVKSGMELHLHRGVFDPKLAVLFEKENAKSTWGTHSKTFAIDDTFIIGSYNMDPHSYKWNTELMVACHDAKDLIFDLETDLQERANVYYDFTKEGTPKNYHQNASLGKRIMYWLIKAPAWVIEDLL
jgi:putative cardiolipin synthase